LTGLNLIRQHLGGCADTSLPLEIIAGLRDLFIIGVSIYGLRLMQQKSELLEREKSLKQSEIDVHKANIERLKTLQPPAFARDLYGLRLKCWRKVPPPPL
jgi:hypothetical protein